MRGFLDALGVEPGRIPADLNAQAALYRSLVAHKQMLIVLDNAATTEQVTPLLPGSGSCTVLVTSRSRLSGLVTRHSAHPLRLNPLSDVESRALLAKRLGAARVAAEEEAVTELIGLCGGFPLALGLIAGRARGHPQVPLAEFTAELRESGVDALDDVDPTASLPAVLSLSLRGLTTDQHMVFALLGIAPGPDIGIPAAASLTGLPVPRVDQALRALADASLLIRQACFRYSMHDLIRRYAIDIAARELNEHVRDTALQQVSTFYIDTAVHADQLVRAEPHDKPDPPEPGSYALLLTDQSAALAWFDAEHRCLLAAQHTAMNHGWHIDAHYLAMILCVYQGRRGHLREKLASQQVGLAAAAHLDRSQLATSHRLLGNALSHLERHEEAAEHLHHSLALAEWPSSQARVHHALSFVYGKLGQHQLALTHARRTLDIYLTLPPPTREAHARGQLGWCLAQCGEYDSARAHCDAALQLARRDRDLACEASTRDTLGYIEHCTGDHHRAIAHYQRAHSLFTEVGNNFEAADTLARLGHPHAVLGQRAEARAAWQKALELLREQGRSPAAERIQQQLDAIDGRDADGDSPSNAVLR
ncbi:tetratricopeptide repeat protein [Crossiella sp. SN42]|uniref:tetratricopeptide repeat protein n=1 Tax=Crossiella sp. SN42 TaxID=2944808 RepID=UPI00207CE7C4|nr:tetratricopeptide repeat protein [Crossiella sp. SN42]MCO1575542.1 tetratricopeptide repeat protein [Crossiella sp. SN42]